MLFCLISTIYASPAGDKKKKAQTCAFDCQKYEPICGTEVNGKKLLTFGSSCVMDRYNCEHPDGKYQLKSKNECGGNVSVRLS
ncbi:uncharacterized protein [Eurosta solidaginis]|uniref:uncharacterized protein isoform X2 n=1 Tax=Eurosta solidaginis TaxID=178769 RepID=UPI00353139FA